MVVGGVFRLSTLLDIDTSRVLFARLRQLLFGGLQLIGAAASGRRRRRLRRGKERRRQSQDRTGRLSERRPVRLEEPTFGHSLDERRRLTGPASLLLRRRVIFRRRLGSGVEDHSTPRRCRTCQLDVGQRLHALETGSARLHRCRQLPRVALVDDRIVRLRYNLQTHRMNTRTRTKILLILIIVIKIVKVNNAPLPGFNKKTTKITVADKCNRFKLYK